MRTRVGYCGGRKEHPTYHDLGDHTEAISLDYDPSAISYKQLLDLFWSSHRCDRTNGSLQYMNAIFYRNDEQKALAQASLVKRASQIGIAESGIQTAVVPVHIFTYAEVYHQKYYLTRYAELREFLNNVYPDGKSLGDSAVATLLNAYLGSGMERNWELFRKELNAFGLPEKLELALRKTADAQIS